MGDFKRGGGGGKRFDGGRGGGFDRRDRGPITMHQATCAECGQDCEVPFRPTEGKPVYCNACFGGKKEPRDNNSYKTPIRTDDGSRQQLEKLNEKMDRLIKAVESMANAKSETEEKKTKKPTKIKKNSKK